jgi:hypothetical protein
VAAARLQECQGKTTAASLEFPVMILELQREQRPELNLSGMVPIPGWA